MDLLTKLVNETPRWHDITPDEGLNDRASILRNLKAAVPIRIQNVADYLFLETDQYDFDLGGDFPNVAPPWPVFFMSYRMPPYLRRKGGLEPNVGAGREYGYLFVAEQDTATDGWVVKTRQFVESVTQGSIWYVSKDGQLLSAHRKPLERGSNAHFIFTPIQRWPEGDWVAPAQFGASEFFAPFLAICFCHCKNVDILSEPVPPKVKAKRERTYGWTTDAWHMLKIEPMRKELASEGAEQPGGLKRSLHIMRGHFKDYREGRGLFGKTHGMWWWNFRLADSSHKHEYKIEN
jgi:hypothetical protein